jgi:hypothetical protein
MHTNLGRPGGLCVIVLVYMVVRSFGAKATKQPTTVLKMSNS